MESPDATWAPQSPDLSSSSYHHSTSNSTSNSTLNHHHSDDTAPRHTQHHRYRGSISSASHISPSSHPHPHTHSLPYPLPTSTPATTFQSRSTTFVASPTTPTSTAFMPRGVRKDASIHAQDGDYSPDAPPPSSRSRGKRPDQGNGIGLVDDSSLTPTSTDHIVIKNHFPVARIKRIMQADDDVGKVAQVTPVVVAKALELFMISLVTKAAAEAKARNSKRVGTVHLKQAIVKDEQFDFLSEIVSKIADAPTAAEKHEGDAMEVDGKKRKTAGRKKKKVDDDDF